jgi:hypothetical protein
MMSNIEVLKKPFKEKSFKDSWIIFSLRLTIGLLKKVRDRPVGLSLLLKTIYYVNQIYANFHNRELSKKDVTN